MANIYGKLLHLIGWTADGDAAPEKKCVILGVPHTSILDFVVAFLFYKSLGHTPHIMIKQEFFKGPLGWLLKKLGAIPVDRSNGAAVVRSVITAVEKAEGEFHLCLSPEGTRKPVRKWKMGYHTIAKALDCPVYLGYFDWNTKHIGIGERFICGENAREDTALVQSLYAAKNYGARHPEKYVTG